METVAVVCALLVGYALVSKRLRSTPITGAMLFVAAGVVLGPDGLGVIEGTRTLESFRLVLETALVLVLFTDAAAIASWDWHRDDRLPVRLLGIGMPLSILLGWGLALALLPGISVWEAALVGAVLAPTDAALGQAVVANERVPRLIRQSLNVESGLNDGLALPFVTMFLALELEHEGGDPFLTVVLLSVVASPAIGAAIGWFGAKGLRAAADRGWAGGAWGQIGLLAVALGAYAAALLVDGSGFIGAWVAGYAVGRADRRAGERAELAEDLGALLATVGFLCFGVLLLGPQIGDIDAPSVVYAVLSLTVVRMLPVGVALLGTGLARPTVLYVGWFGPRGLASIVFTLLAVEEGLGHGSDLVLAATVTVSLSILVHGATAVSGSEKYADWYGRAAIARPDLPEGGSVQGPAVRRRLSGDPWGRREGRIQ